MKAHRIAVIAALTASLTGCAIDPFLSGFASGYQLAGYGYGSGYGYQQPTTYVYQPSVVYVPTPAPAHGYGGGHHREYR